MSLKDTTPSSLGVYRSDAVDMAVTTDLARNKYVSSGQVDYSITSIVDGEWWNYTAVYTNPPFNAWLHTPARRPARCGWIGSSAIRVRRTRRCNS